MKIDYLEKSVQTLIERAARANDSADAMRLTQAAANASNAVCALLEARMKAKN